jgi:hypothetical protein
MGTVTAVVLVEVDDAYNSGVYGIISPSLEN